MKHAFASMAAIACALGAGQVQAGPVQTRDVAIERDGLAAPLAGTFAGEAGSGTPGIVILPGSGPTDRDGNTPMVVQASTYRLLAQELAASGIPSIRIDKRGLFGSAKAIPNPNEVSIDDYAGDALAWAARMREETGANCAWLLGHSEGGLIALAAAVSAPQGLCGVILAASPGRPVGEVLREQVAANLANGPLMDEFDKHVTTLASGKRIEGPVHPGLAPLFGPQIQTYMISLLTQDPAANIAGLTLPVLILQGTEDLQVTLADGRALAAAQSKAWLVIFTGANHMLKTVEEGDRAANLASYSDPDLPLAKGLTHAIVTFVERYTRIGD